MASHVFEETCEEFDLKNCENQEALNERLLDPCSCYKYYQCTNNYELLHLECAPGTALDPDTDRCVHSPEVTFNFPCDETTNVWTRCNVTESRQEELMFICTNKTQTTFPTSKQTVTPPSLASSEPINPGIIIGSIIGGAVIAVIVLIAAFLLYKRKKKPGINKNRNSSAHNPEYFEGGHPNDPYAVINDAHLIRGDPMTDPAYNGSTLQTTINRSNGSYTNTGFEASEVTEYDNSGLGIVHPGYTQTLRRSLRHYETAAGASSSRTELQTDGTGNHMSENQSQDVTVDVNGNKNKTCTVNPSELEGNDVAVAEQGSPEHLSGHTHEDAPDYHVLEKNEGNKL